MKDYNRFVLRKSSYLSLWIYNIIVMFVLPGMSSNSKLSGMSEIVFQLFFEEDPAQISFLVSLLLDVLYHERMHHMTLNSSIPSLQMLFKLSPLQCESVGLPACLAKILKAMCNVQYAQTSGATRIFFYVQTFIGNWTNTEESFNSVPPLA